VVFYDDPIRIDPKHVISYSTSTVTKALGRTSLEILRPKLCTTEFRFGHFRYLYDHGDHSDRRGRCDSEGV